jgi:hypothetical protein
MVDSRIDWAEWVFKQQFSERKDIVRECVKMFEAAFPKVSGSDMMAVVEQEVLSDMALMQLQPDIMDNHRRFVMIAVGSELEQDGVSVRAEMTRCGKGS